MPAQTSPFQGFKAMGLFLFLGAGMAFLAGTTLLWPGTLLDRLWILNPRAYRQLSPLGTTAGIAFLLLGVILAVAGGGWGRRPHWGWGFAVGLISNQGFGRLVDAPKRDSLRGGAGFPFFPAPLYFF